VTPYLADHPAERYREGHPGASFPSNSAGEPWRRATAGEPWPGADEHRLPPAESFGAPVYPVAGRAPEAYPGPAAPGSDAYWTPPREQWAEPTAELAAEPAAGHQMPYAGAPPGYGPDRAAFGALDDAGPAGPAYDPGHYGYTEPPQPDDYPGYPPTTPLAHEGGPAMGSRLRQPAYLPPSGGEPDDGRHHTAARPPT
jgi:hypothetical protein